MLGPTIDEDNQINDIEASEAVLHVMSIAWKVVFALVPPRRIGNGWFAFVISIILIGVTTAVVEQFANLLGCAIGLPQSVTAITLVALGTSVPDTFASKTAA